jgi:hypothetical protein
MWTIVDGAVAEEEETFDDKYPHCLPGTELDADSYLATACEVPTDCDNADYGYCSYGGFCENGSNALQYETELAMLTVGMYSELSDVGIFWAPGYYYDSDDHTSYTYDDIIYYAEELPIYSDRTARLCANIYDADDATARILYAAADGQFDPDAAAITADTAAEDYPENVTNLTSFLTEEDWDYYTEY